MKPRFPLALQQPGIAHGEVHLLLEVDASAQLTDCLVTAFTRREFAAEALKAAHTWRYKPARLGGRPVGSVVPLTVLFESNGGLAVIRQMEPLPGRAAHYEYEPCHAHDLDTTPKALSTPAPQYPKELGDQGIVGRVVVDFHIDETGRVRIPVAQEPADPRLAGLAITARKAWTFERPMCGGLPVLACASTSFAFDLTP